MWSGGYDDPGIWTTPSSSSSFRCYYLWTLIKQNYPNTYMRIYIFVRRYNLPTIFVPVSISHKILFCITGSRLNFSECHAEQKVASHRRTAFFVVFKKVNINFWLLGKKVGTFVRDQTSLWVESQCGSTGSSQNIISKPFLNRLFLRAAYAFLFCSCSGIWIEFTFKWKTFNRYSPIDETFPTMVRLGRGQCDQKKITKCL